MDSQIDYLLGGTLRLRQPARGHRAGTDTVLLAAASRDLRGHVIDAGAGVGTVGLALALRQPLLRVTLIETVPENAAYARENAGLNGLDARVNVAETDLLIPKMRRAAGLADGRADGVVTNPPYFERGRVQVSGHNARAMAHVLDAGGLTLWIAACLALLRPGGLFVMIHRPQALAEILVASAGRMGGVTIRPVHPQQGKAATRILVRGQRGSRAAPAILPGLVLHQPDGSFAPHVEAIHRGEAGIPAL